MGAAHGDAGRDALMVEWRPFRAADRPVPEPVATPFVWAAAFTGALLTVGVLSVANGLADPLHALLVLCALAGLLSVCARFAAAPGTAAVCWLFLNGFAVPPQGELTWQGYPDAGRLGFLMVAALLGTVIARLVNARGAYRRITPGGDRDARS